MLPDIEGTGYLATMTGRFRLETVARWDHVVLHHIGLVAVGLCLCVCFGCRRHELEEARERGRRLAGQIRIGDTEERVIEILGPGGDVYSRGQNAHDRNYIEQGVLVSFREGKVVSVEIAPPLKMRRRWGCSRAHWHW